MSQAQTTATQLKLAPACRTCCARAPETRLTNRWPKLQRHTHSTRLTNSLCLPIRCSPAHSHSLSSTRFSFAQVSLFLICSFESRRLHSDMPNGRPNQAKKPHQLARMRSVRRAQQVSFGRPILLQLRSQVRASFLRLRRLLRRLRRRRKREL